METFNGSEQGTLFAKPNRAGTPPELGMDWETLSSMLRTGALSTERILDLLRRAGITDTQHEQLRWQKLFSRSNAPGHHLDFGKLIRSEIGLYLRVVNALRAGNATDGRAELARLRTQNTSAFAAMRPKLERMFKR